MSDREIASPEWTILAIDQQDNIVWDLELGPDLTVFRLVTLSQKGFTLIKQEQNPASFSHPMFACSNGVGNRPSVWPDLEPGDELEYIESDKGGLQVWIKRVNLPSTPLHERGLGR